MTYGAIARTDQEARILYPPDRPSSFIINPALFRGHHYGSGRGCYRIYGPDQYLYYWDTVPITENSVLKAVDPTIDYETSDTFIDGIKYFGARYTNGIYTSPLLPVGPNGEIYYRLDLDSGTEKISPPANPFDVRLLKDTGGVILVIAGYFESAQTIRANQFAITATFNGTDPGEDSPDYTSDISKFGPARMRYALPAQADGVTVKVRVQMRRNDGTVESPDYTYSETDASNILTTTADAAGPSVPLDGEVHPGSVPGEI